MQSVTSGVVGGLPARLEVRLLGAVEVTLDGRRLRAFSSGRPSRALAPAPRPLPGRSLGEIELKGKGAVELVQCNKTD